MELILERTLRLDDITEQSEFSTRDSASIERAQAQAAIFRTINWTEQETDVVLDLLEYIDLLNIKYLHEYDMAGIDLDVIHGLKLSYDRALGAVAYGLLEPLYDEFKDRPEIYQALFGVQLGRRLFDHSQKMDSILDELDAWRDRLGVARQESIETIIEMIGTVAQAQLKLATALGMPEGTVNKVNRDMFEDRITGTPVDLDELRNDIAVSGGDTITERIREGREMYTSGLYISREDVEHIEDDAQRRDILKAMERAKQKDRAKAALYQEWRTRSDRKNKRDLDEPTNDELADLNAYEEDNNTE